jgi:transposase-like protein
LTDTGGGAKAEGIHIKTQLSKPVREKRKFTKQYKEEALEHWKSSGRSAATVAEELGIRALLLNHSAQETRASVKMEAKDLEAEIRRKTQNSWSSVKC